MSDTSTGRGFTTAILHSDRETTPIEHGALHKPLHVSVAYGYKDATDLIAVFQGRQAGYAYGRQGNPTTAALEAKVTAMEQGVASVCFATGMAAIEAMLLALLRGGDHIVSSAFVFDNTMTSPWLFRPALVGAGLVVNALTKYIGGHGNALGGAVTDTGLFDWTRFPNIADAYKTQKPALWGVTQLRKKGLRDGGATLTAVEAHHISAGAETLALRLERQCANAQALAEFLASHPAVRAVYFPGLPSHPQHALASALFRAPGALLSFELGPGRDLLAFLNRLRVVVLSSNLGDNRTLAIPVAQTIFWEMGAARRAEMGIADSLIRVSVGIEDRDDLIGDFRQALD